MSYHYYTDFQQIIALMFGDKRTNFALTKGGRGVDNRVNDKSGRAHPVRGFVHGRVGNWGVQPLYANLSPKVQDSQRNLWTFVLGRSDAT